MAVGNAAHISRPSSTAQPLSATPPDSAGQLQGQVPFGLQQQRQRQQQLMMQQQYALQHQQQQQQQQQILMQQQVQPPCLC